MYGMFLEREQSLDHRLLPKTLMKLVGILRLCLDPVTSRAVWAMCQHFKFDDSPVSGVHEMGYDYNYNEHGENVWAISPLNNEISRARKTDIRNLRRLGLDLFVETTGDIPTTRLDASNWDWESEQ